MRMVIFGAGASFDSVPSRPPKEFTRQAFRPPLADQLFEDRADFLAAMSRFPQCKPIAVRLQRRPEGVSVEGLLERFRLEGENYPTRHVQLAAVRFYLHFNLWECVGAWSRAVHGMTNHISLLDELERTRDTDERICLVTFNYDRMIEDALASVGVKMVDFDDYVTGDRYVLVKLHGSVDWGRKVLTRIDSVEDRNSSQIAAELIECASQLDLSDELRRVTERPMGRHGDEAVFPAIAIPVQKKAKYECPRTHVEALRAMLPAITRILIVGWRATEERFIGELVENIQPGVRVLVVSDNDENARATIEELARAGLDGSFFTYGTGFTDFVIHGANTEF